MKYFISGVIAIVLILLGVGIYFAGTPADVRAEKLDNQRIQDLQNIQWQVVEYYANTNELPASFDILEKRIERQFIIDPETKQKYEYAKLSDTQFELCASFSSSQQDTSQIDPYYISPRRPIPTSQKEIYIVEEDWSHDIGRTCFTRTIEIDEVMQGEDVDMKN